jgi:hypothetical protein
MDAAAWQDPRVIAIYELRGKSVDIKEGSKENTVLKLISLNR